MALVSDVIYGALRLCQIRDTSDIARLTEALDSLNLMLRTWEESMIIPTREALTLISAQNEYTIGTGGDFNTTRPLSIMSAFIRDSAGTDYPLEVSLSPIDYGLITDKDTAARPYKLYYAPGFTGELGTIYFDSAPVTAETLYLTSYKGFTPYTALADTIVQPPEYEKAMRYYLAIDLAPEYGMIPDPTIIQQALIMKNNIEVRNSKTPNASFDTALLR